MTDKKKTETLTVRADEVRVGDWIEWLEVTIAQALGMDIYRHPALLTDEENYLPATVLREGWGDPATPSPDRGAA